MTSEVCEIHNETSSSCQTNESKEVHLDVKISSAPSLSTKLLYFIFGTTSLLGWNAFVTNTLYFNNRVSENVSLFQNFETSFLICSMVPLIIGNLLNLFIFYKLKESARIIVTLSICIFCFIITIIVVSSNTSAPLFFATIMLLSIILNLCSPVMCSPFFNELAYFGIICVIYFLAGQSFSGLFVAILKLIIISINLSDQLTSIIYFSAALIFLVLTLVLYLLFIRSKAYLSAKRHYETSQKQVESIETLPLKDQLKNYSFVLKKKWREATGLFVNMALTLAIWPVIPVSISSIYTNTVWASSYFLTFMVFFTFSLGDCIGRYTKVILPWPKQGSIFTFLVPLSRIVFLILFLACARNKTEGVFPLIFNHDVAPIIFVLLFSVMNGHMLSVLFDAPYTFTESLHIKACSVVFVLVLGCGLSAGACLTFVTKLL